MPFWHGAGLRPGVRNRSRLSAGCRHFEAGLLCLLLSIALGLQIFERLTRRLRWHAFGHLRRLRCTGGCDGVIHRPRQKMMRLFARDDCAPLWLEPANEAYLSFRSASLVPRQPEAIRSTHVTLAHV